MEKKVPGDIGRLIDRCVDFAEPLLADCEVRICCSGELEPVEYYDGEFAQPPLADTALQQLRPRLTEYDKPISPPRDPKASFRYFYHIKKEDN